MDSQNPLKMKKAFQQFNDRQYLQCVETLTAQAASEKASGRGGKTGADLESTMLYGVSLLEFALQYRAEYDAYTLKRLDYEAMAARGAVEPQLIDDIPAPELYVREARSALQRALEIVCHVDAQNDTGHQNQKSAKYAYWNENST